MAPATPGAITIAGVIYDGNGEPVVNHLIETWQADQIITVKPGQVPGPAGVLQAPHIDVSVFARRVLQRLVTRIYFGDEEPANATDTIAFGSRHAPRGPARATDRGWLPVRYPASG